MARMGKDGYSTASEQLAVRVPPDLKDEFKEWCDERGLTMTDVVQELLLMIVGGGELENDWLPDDQRLVDAWKALEAHANPNTGHISAEAAETILSDELNIKKATVKPRLLQPLENHDPPLIKAVWGDLYVRRAAADKPEPVDPGDTDGDDFEAVHRDELKQRMDELAAAAEVDQ